MKDWAEHSLREVSRTRQSRATQPPLVFADAETQALLREFHPDHADHGRRVSLGANAGDRPFPPELADLLEADSPLAENFASATDLETDVLIIGGGGAGVSAALELEGAGLSVHLATKLRLGDSNTVMAEGGIQSSLGDGDSAARHFADSYVGGHGNNDTGLLRILCEAAPDAIRRLARLGCLFDQNADGTFRLRRGGGTSIPRILTCRDYTGLEIMRVLRDAMRQGTTHLLERHAAVELTDDGQGQVTGAVLWNSATDKLLAVSARAVLLATGGSGQLRLQGFPTSNHLGATGDGLVLAYRQGCRLVHMDSFQYHPSGACYPEALAGQLLTESIRAIGAQLLNADGARFVDEMTYRDVVAAAILRECRAGRGVNAPSGRVGVWLDTPLIDLKQGAGTLHRRLPGLMHRFARYGIDPAEQPLLVYPTLHYQNGGICIDDQCRTEAVGLWAAGEVTGGLHGTNRLMGNSLLDILVFGRRAACSIRDNLPRRGAVTLAALAQHRKNLQQLQRPPGATAPKLYPDACGLKITPASGAGR
ncbi:MAG: FAD-binding protein [Nitrospinales bacterium]